jgi:hypothetical protein
MKLALAVVHQSLELSISFGSLDLLLQAGAKTFDFYFTSSNDSALVQAKTELLSAISILVEMPTVQV